MKGIGGIMVFCEFQGSDQFAGGIFPMLQIATHLLVFPFYYFFNSKNERCLEIHYKFFQIFLEAFEIGQNRKLFDVGFG